MNYDMKQSGERIRQLRIKNGITQEKIAETLNIDRSFYSRIESGKNGCSVDLFTSAVAAALLGLSPDMVTGRGAGLSDEGLRRKRNAIEKAPRVNAPELTREGIIKATVETVAENFSDGALAPLFYMLLGGAPLAMMYKAVNTMDSMVGYKNDRYLYFGRAAAKLDDAANLLPSRLAALLWIVAAGLTGQDMAGAFRIWRRDRRNHTSPNSAQCESACAGVLGVELAGPAYYFGQLYEKPTIGEPSAPLRRRTFCGSTRRCTRPAFWL